MRPAPGRSTKLFYGLGAVAFGVKDNGFSFFLLLYYNQVLGLPEAWVGLALMLALVADALSDPVVGHWSDHLHSRWGRRHPFMYASALPIAVSYVLLWNPPPGLSHEGLFVWLLVLAIVVRTCLTFYEVPSTALAAELTQRYDERTQVLGLRFFFGWWGGLTMAIVAYAVYLQPDAQHPIGQLNPDGYRGYGVVAAIVMLAAILLSSIGTHGYIPHLKSPPPARALGLRGWLAELRESLHNRNFLVLFGANVFAAMAGGLSAALNIYFNTYFWRLTSDQITVLALGNFVSAAIALALAPRVSSRFGKKPAAIRISLAAIVVGPLPIALRLFGLLPPDPSALLLLLLLLFNTIIVTLIIMSSIVTASMIADIVEESELSTGRRSEGLFFAANTFVQKTVSGIGIFVSTLLLRAIGFPADAKPDAVDPVIVERLGIIFAPTLVVLYGCALAFLSRYRISRAGHEENLRRLAARGS
ncbi:MAG: MFS transporter [bacterium]|nr:MFS transporter [bacterium]